jgi:hypothetical protein
MSSCQPSLTPEDSNGTGKSSRLCDDEGLSKDLTETLKEKRAFLEISSIELELKERTLALKAKELEHKKRARDLEYESIDKAVDRYAAYCSSGETGNIEMLEEKLKAKYRRMLDEA